MNHVFIFVVLLLHLAYAVTDTVYGVHVMTCLVSLWHCCDSVVTVSRDVLQAIEWKVFNVLT